VIRFGLCCIFHNEPIKFSTTTATCVAKMSRLEGLKKVSNLVKSNVEALMQAITYCSNHGIGCFRVGSSILPLKTHPELGYTMEELPDGLSFIELFQNCGEFAKQKDIRLCFHPDQFVVLNSLKDSVVDLSIKEIEYQSEVASWIGADVVNIHGGGAFNDKKTSLDRLKQNIGRLSQNAKSKLTLENDDRTYTPDDLIPVCESTGVPLLYDVHHHRCNPDRFDIYEATELAIMTWNSREPMFHISSPLEGWSGPKPMRHHDYIDPYDFPKFWSEYDLTVEVEAKAKEVAILKLMQDLKKV